MSSRHARSWVPREAFCILSAAFILWGLSMLISNLGLRYYPTIYRATFERPLVVVLVSLDLDSFVALALALTYLVLAAFLLYRGAIRKRLTFINVLALFTIVALLWRLVVLAEIVMVLLGLLWLCLLTANSDRLFGVSGAVVLVRTLSYLLLMLVFISAASVARWTLDPLFPSKLYEGIGWHFSLTELQIFYSGSVLCPIYLVLGIGVVVIFPIARAYISSVMSLLGRVGKGLNEVFHIWLDGVRAGPILPSKGTLNRMGLLAAVAVSLAMVCYPYLGAINPKGSFAGVDLVFYQAYLDEMISRDLAGALSYAFSGSGPRIIAGDRPFSLLLHYLLLVITGLPPSEVVKFVPVILSPLYVGSIFIFVRELEGNSNVAAIGALLASASFTVTVGMYGGLLANWFALPAIYLGLTAFSRSLKHKSRKMLALSVLALVFALFTHPYTWAVTVVSLFLYLLWILFERYHRRLELQRWALAATVTVLVANSLADLVKSQVLFSASGLAVESQIAFSTLSLGNLASFWQNLVLAIGYLMGGYFTHPLALFLFVLGTYVVVRREDAGSRILIAWLSVVALPLFFGSFPVQPRVLYVLPFDVLSAIGLCSIMRALYRKDGRDRRAVAALFLTWVLLAYLNYGFRCMRNLLSPVQ